MNKSILLLMGSMIMNALAMDKVNNEDELVHEELQRKLVETFIAFPYASEFANSPRFDQDLYQKWFDEQKSPVVIAPKNKESGCPKVTEKS